MKPDPQVLDFQLLCVQISIRFHDQTLLDKLRYIPVRAVQSMPMSARFNWEVLGEGPYTLLEEGDELARLNTRNEVQFSIFQRVYQRVLDRYVMAGWIALHGGLININGRRVLLLGDKGTGKTTLIASLMAQGHQFEGDELALVKHSKVMACPRLMHFKPGTARHVPRIASALRGAPQSRAGGTVIRAIDPTDLGYSWDIRTGPIDNIVCLAANHGGETTLDSLNSLQTLELLLANYLGWGNSREQVKNYALKMATRGGYRLHLGDPDAGIRQLQALCAH